jgi:hypothetical protein
VFLPNASFTLHRNYVKDLAERMREYKVSAKKGYVVSERFMKALRSDNSTYS